MFLKSVFSSQMFCCWQVLENQCIQWQEKAFAFDNSSSTEHWLIEIFATAQKLTLATNNSPYALPNLILEFLNTY